MPSVLLIEDDMISAMVLKMFLEEAGYTVMHASNTDEAMTYTNEHKPDFLLSDWSVAGATSPADVARTLKKIHPSAKLVFISGYPKEDIEASLPDLKPITVYSKPIDPENILAALPKLP